MTEKQMQDVRVVNKPIQTVMTMEDWGRGATAIALVLLFLVGWAVVNPSLFVGVIVFLTFVGAATYGVCRYFGMKW